MMKSLDRFERCGPLQNPHPEFPGYSDEPCSPSGHGTTEIL